MKFLIWPDKVYFHFNEVFILKYLKKLALQIREFGAADPGIVTIQRIFHAI
jgi:hypothetical protein